MNEFINLENLRNDYELLWLQFNNSHTEIKEIINTISERITAEKKQTTERLVTLKKQSEDISRPQTVRNIASMEMQKLKNIRFSPTEDEKAAFEEEFEKWQTVLQDIRKTKSDFDEAIRAAKQKIDDIQVWKNSGVKDPGLVKNWMDDIIKKFNRLEQEGN